MNKANVKRNTKTLRTLGDLISIGPAMVRDFNLLGVESVADLARQDPEKLYRKLCRITGQRQDLCVLDTFRAGVAQARNPRLPVEQCQWWYWSRKRKASGAGPDRAGIFDFSLRGLDFAPVTPKPHRLKPAPRKT
jgi:hypothetical protein